MRLEQSFLPLVMQILNNTRNRLAQNRQKAAMSKLVERQITSDGLK